MAGHHGQHHNGESQVASLESRHAWNRGLRCTDSAETPVSHCESLGAGLGIPICHTASLAFTLNIEGNIWTTRGLHLNFFGAP